jgi:hypothetical protein
MIEKISLTTPASLAAPLCAKGEKMRPYICILAFSILLLSCAHEPSYTESLSQRPLPTDEQAKSQECAWIRSEIARMQIISAYSVTNQYGFLIQATAHKNIAALENRAALLRCGAAFSTTHVIEKQDSTSPIDECIKACKENTNRTPEQCFDACNK